jgi:hypothetical protein
LSSIVGNKDTNTQIPVNDQEKGIRHFLGTILTPFLTLKYPSPQKPDWFRSDSIKSSISAVFHDPQEQERTKSVLKKKKYYSN